jgi:Lon protease-like protein
MAVQPDTGRQCLGEVPLFPLPNVVLFPRAVLPLHIFEERYKTMTADTLSSSRQVAMAMLKPGWERDYYHRPPIEPVVCVGKILSHERLSDGTYNFLLQGDTRAIVVSERMHHGYRIAELQTLPETPVMEIDLAAERDRLIELFSAGILARAPLARQFRKILYSPIPTPGVADLIAFNLLDDIALKQQLLAEPDVRRRIHRTIEALEAIQPKLASTYRYPTDPSSN